MARLDAERLQSVALDWLDVDLRPRLIVSRDGLLHWINASARDMLGRVPDIALTKDHIGFRNGHDDDRFRAYLASIDGRMRTIALPFDGGGSHVLFRGHYMPASGAVCLEIALDHATYRPALADFEKVFGLTGSEARTATALFEGYSVSDVATAHKVSIDTVRTHVRQIYAKLGTGTREQFFRRLQPYRIA